MLKSILAYIGSIAKAVFIALKIKSICQSDATTQEKQTQVAAKLEEFRASCANSAASTESEWDDKIFEGLADWLDDAAAAIVAAWGTT